jgi:hypothetical protein
MAPYFWPRLDELEAVLLRDLAAVPCSSHSTVPAVPIVSSYLSANVT